MNKKWCGPLTGIIAIARAKTIGIKNPLSLDNIANKQNKRDKKI